MRASFVHSRVKTLVGHQAGGRLLDLVEGMEESDRAKWDVSVSGSEGKKEVAVIVEDEGRKKKSYFGEVVREAVKIAENKGNGQKAVVRARPERKVRGGLLQKMRQNKDSLE